jgi:hypothetical protein
MSKSLLVEMLFKCSLKKVVPFFSIYIVANFILPGSYIFSVNQHQRVNPTQDAPNAFRNLTRRNFEIAF